jgi:16S rRNA (cytidine1402-2'-O)-methyltransferase
MGHLFVIATPIGNLEDVSLRALRVLGEVRVIAAEDTRTARILLDRHGVKGPRLVSYTDHNAKARIPELLAALDTGDVALVTDAGTPAISDPGVDLVAAARAAGHEVVAVPGPSAVVAALSVAGLPTLNWRFAGFLPRAAGELRALRALLEEQSRRPETLVAFESPQRLRKSLAIVAEVLPERRIAVCRELTKLHEEVFVGTAAEALAHFETVRGEIVLIIEGGEPERPVEDESALRAEVADMRRLGLTQAQASALLTRRYAVSRRRLYELWLASEQA